MIKQCQGGTMKKIPQRTCVICHSKFDKRDLFRIVSDKSGEIFLIPLEKQMDAVPMYASLNYVWINS